MNKKEIMMYRLVILLLCLAVVSVCWMWFKSGSYDNQKPCCKDGEKSCCTEVAKENQTYAILSTEGEVAENIQLPTPTKKGGMPLMETLSLRQTTRSYDTVSISDQQLSDLLWAASGVTREDGKMTAPTACDAREIDLYVYTKKGIYLFEPATHSLKLHKAGDYRAAAGRQAFYEVAPVAITLVGSNAKMDKAKYDAHMKEFYSATDAGFVSQNIYLYCASEGLSTVVCGNIDREAIATLLDLKEDRILLSHPIGY